jgi:hypothetical protein
VGPPADPLPSRLRSLALALEAGDPLDPVEARWLEKAPWLARDARERRDGLIRALGASFSGTVRAKALRVQAEIRHYGSVCWPNDRRRGEPYPRSDRRVTPYEMFTLDPDPPQSERQLNTILAAEVCNK